MENKKIEDKELLETEDIKKIEKERVAAALSYVWILALVPYFFNRDSETVKFHSRQGVTLFLVETLLFPLYVFPLFGQALFLFFLVVSALGASKAYGNEKWEIPYIFDLSKKIKL